MKAEAYVGALKNAVDAIWENYGNPDSLKDLVYGEHGYGILQRVELEEITEMLNTLKRKTDDLSDECVLITSQDQSLCVLVIDDNTDFLNLVGMFLKKSGMEADLASGGVEGLRLLMDNPAKYALVLLDIQMEDMDGYGVLQRIRESACDEVRSKPVVAMSGKAKSTDCANFDFYLRKPFNLDVFIPTLRDVLNKRSG